MNDRTGTWITGAKQLIDPAMRSAIAALDDRNRLVAEYHLGFADAGGRPTSGDGGKTIRGALALLAARVVGGRIGDAVPASVAVEMIHHYSLLHDDIIDRDHTRRHRPAAWIVFGIPAAILAGDAMAARATGVLLESGGPSSARAAMILSEATAAMLAGQAADIAFETMPEVTLDDCRVMVADKTGALLAAAASMGAAICGADEEIVAALHRYGHHVGMAFQLVDDLLGIWGDPELTGKPVAADLVARKKSLPVVAALAAGGETAATIRRHYDSAEDLADTALVEVADAVEASGARHWVANEAERETEAALAIVRSLPTDDETAADLTALTVTLCRRTA